MTPKLGGIEWTISAVRRWSFRQRSLRDPASGLRSCALMTSKKGRRHLEAFELACLAFVVAIRSADNNQTAHIHVNNNDDGNNSSNNDDDDDGNKNNRTSAPRRRNDSQ